MKGLEFFAIEKRKESEAPYLWVPVHTDANLGYFALHGDVPVEGFHALKKHGLSEQFFKHLANTSSLWLTQAIHKNLGMEIREKRHKGYQSYGEYTGTAYLLHLVNEAGRRTPCSFEAADLKAALTEGYNRALFRPEIPQLAPSLAANLEGYPVWG